MTNCIVDAAGKEAKNVVIGGLTKNLLIQIGDVLVTATNMNDVLGDGGSVKYDGIGKLTLTNAIVNGTDYALITRAKGTLEIEVNGNCYLNNKSTTENPYNTLYLNTNTTLTGTGQLLINHGVNILGVNFIVDGPTVICNDGHLRGWLSGERSESLVVKSGKLYARNMTGFEQFTLADGITITTPEGGSYDTSAQQVVNRDGTMASGVQIGPGAAYVETTGIRLSETSLTLTAIGATATLQPVFTPANATNQTVTWTTSNEYVATVSSKGKVTAKGQGTATITAKTASGHQATCEVTVNTTVLAQSLTLNKQELELRILNDDFYYESEKLVPVFSPTNVTDKSVEWTVADGTVASVDNSGLVTAKGIGKTTVTCRTTDGSGLVATCTVTVISFYTESYGRFSVNIREDEDDYVPMTCNITDFTNHLCEVCVSAYIYDPEEDSEPHFDRAIEIETRGEITIPDKVVWWKDYGTYQVTHIGDNAFQDCQWVTSFSLPEGLLTIGREAFSGCSGVETVILPSTLLSIDVRAFELCAMVKDVYLPAATPPEVSETAFKFGRMLDIDKNDITPTHVLHVPAASLKLYREQAWTAWFDKIVPIDPVEGDLDGDGEVTIYDAELITYYLFGEVPADFDVEAADLNHDGVVNIADVTVVIQKIVE